MKTIRCAFIAIMLILTASHTHAQFCGDVNASGSVGIPDVTFLVNYLFAGGSAPPDSTRADMDDRYGITIADLYALQDNLFSGNPPLDCSINQDYHYTCARLDTVYLPYAVNIPDAVGSIQLPLIVSWEGSTRGSFLPFDPVAPGSNGIFTYSGFVPAAGVTWRNVGPDVLVGQGQVSTPGHDTLGYFQYTRSSAGIGKIVVDKTDLSPWLRHAIEKGDYNLHCPVALWAYLPGDVNCDGSADIADLTYLVNWSFKGGPPPCNPYSRP